ncbi:MAG: MotA/TolQ/ExbB proton channel family protein, partial [Proteobacteria bacterium]|nr:MotA/TolQ/ExbB proton channel family protein [Pseudomonadota bacterium]
MQMELGLAHFWTQADAVNRSVALLLFLLSVGSWTLIAGKLLAVWQARRSHGRALNAFWGAATLPEAMQ